MWFFSIICHAVPIQTWISSLTKKQPTKQTIKQSNNQTIKQSNNQANKQTNKQTNKHLPPCTKVLAPSFCKPPRVRSDESRIVLSALNFSTWILNFTRNRSLVCSNGYCHPISQCSAEPAAGGTHNSKILPGELPSEQMSLARSNSSLMREKLLLEMRRPKLQGRKGSCRMSGER